MPTKKRNCKFPATQLNQIWVENTKSSSEKNQTTGIHSTKRFPGSRKDYLLNSYSIKTILFQQRFIPSLAVMTLRWTVFGWYVFGGLNTYVWCLELGYNCNGTILLTVALIFLHVSFTDISFQIWGLHFCGHQWIVHLLQCDPGFSKTRNFFRGRWDFHGISGRRWWGTVLQR